MTLQNTPRLDALLKRIAAATRERGKKTELAKYLGVPLPRITEWLSGVFSPGGEVTLQLLEWVTAEEAKQKGKPERAQTRPGRKTRLRKSANENHKPSPK